MGATRNTRIAGEEVTDMTPEGQEVTELDSDQVAGMDRHVKATGGVQVAESCGTEVPGRESPVKAPDWEQETKPSCAEICAGEAGSDQASEEVPGRESPVEVPHGEQETNPSCAAVCAGEAGPDKPDEAPDDTGQDTGKTRNARTAREEIPRCEGQEVNKLQSWADMSRSQMMDMGCR